MKKRFNQLVLSKPFLYITALAFIAILLRVLRFDEFTTFGHDNSRDNIVSYKMFAYGEYIFVGPVFSVIWGYMSPIYYYMLYPFYLLFNFRPMSAPIASLVANLATLGLLAYSSFRLYGKAAAFISALIFGFSVYVIKLGGEGLNPSLMLPFSILAFYSYIQWLKSSRSKLLYIFAFALSFVTALHPAGFFLLVPFAVLYFFYKPNIKPVPFLIASAIYGTLGVLPYLIQEKKLAWWTIKKLIEYMKTEKTGDLTFLQSMTNFFMAVLKNISLVLFNNTNQIGQVLAALVLGFIVYESIIFIKNKNNSTILAFTLLFYILTFGLLVKFDTSEPHTKWFAAAFVPLIVLYISSLLTRLYRTNYWGSAILILAGITLLNISMFFTIPREDDSYSYVREVSEIIRQDSQGADIDIYGGNPEPIYYILWYYENDPELKEKYFTWIKWAKEKDADLVYYVEEKSVLDHNKIEEIKDKHGVENFEELYTSEIGKKVYVLR